MNVAHYSRWCWKCHKPHHRFTHFPSCMFCKQHCLFPSVHFVIHIAESMRKDAEKNREI